MNVRNMPFTGTPGPKLAKLPKGKNVKRASEEALDYIRKQVKALWAHVDAAEQLSEDIHQARVTLEKAEEQVEKQKLTETISQMKFNFDKIRKAYEDQENFFSRWLYGHPLRKSWVQINQEFLKDESNSKEEAHQAKIHIQEVKGRKPRELKKWTKLGILKYPDFPY